MSYCRLGEESDVYMYHDVCGYITCCFCSMVSEHEQDPRFTTRTEAAHHLRAHVVKGEKVPPYAFRQLFNELHEEGDSINGTSGIK